MIIITSEVVIKEAHWSQALSLAKSHVEASRLEPGCISHRFLISPEKDHCIFFYEEWQDRAAIASHFEQPYSKEISKDFNEWAVDQVKINFHKVAE